VGRSTNRSLQTRLEPRDLSPGPADHPKLSQTAPARARNRAPNPPKLKLRAAGPSPAPTESSRSRMSSTGDRKQVE
jgi:hypothetical protein